MHYCKYILIVSFLGREKRRRERKGDSDLLRDAVQRLWSADIKTDEHSITVWIRQGPYIIIIRGPCRTQAQWGVRRKTLHYDKADVRIKERNTANGAHECCGTYKLCTVGQTAGQMIKKNNVSPVVSSWAGRNNILTLAYIYCFCSIKCVYCAHYVNVFKPPLIKGIGATFLIYLLFPTMQYA